MSEDRIDVAWRESAYSSATGSDCVEVAAVWEERD